MARFGAALKLKIFKEEVYWFPDFSPGFAQETFGLSTLQIFDCWIIEGLLWSTTIIFIWFIWKAFETSIFSNKSSANHRLSANTCALTNIIGRNQKKNHALQLLFRNYSFCYGRKSRKPWKKFSEPSIFCQRSRGRPKRQNWRGGYSSENQVIQLN